MRARLFGRWLTASLMIGSAALLSGGCCPESLQEVCQTPAQWSDSSLCAHFPPAASGAQCPTAAEVGKSCKQTVGGERVDGEKCCYEMQLPCS
jgi:hypothetical protein